MGLPCGERIVGEEEWKQDQQFELLQFCRHQVIVDYPGVCFIDYAKAFDCVNHNKLENSERDGNTSPPDLPLEKFVCRSGSNS